MKREEDHWRLYRYLRTPLVDVGIDEAVSVKAIRMPGENLDLFRPKTLRTVCADDLEVPAAAEMVIDKLSDGGHFIACNITPEAIKAMAAKSQIQEWKEHGFHIVRRLSGSNGIARKADPVPVNGRKKACLVRYGAIGDHLMVTPLVQHYKDLGYHVTYNCTEKGEAIYEKDPRIDDLLVQETGIVPPDARISRFWEKMSKDYDEFVNLSEVVEGELLRIEGRPEFSDPWEKRAADCSGKYIDNHFRRAGVDGNGMNPKIWLSEKEKAWAKEEVARVRRKLGKSTIVLWNIMGSSFHKMYPWVFDVWNLVRLNGDDIAFIAVGDEMSHFVTGREFASVAENACGRLKMRQSLSLHSAVDAVVTPETWSLIAALGFDAPLIALLSHSAKSNYSWRKGDVPLHASIKNCPCYPCHQLHYTRMSCPRGVREKSATRCMDQLDPVKIYKELLKIAGNRREGDEHYAVSA